MTTPHSKVHLKLAPSPNLIVLKGVGTKTVTVTITNESVGTGPVTVTPFLENYSRVHGKCVLPPQGHGGVWTPPTQPTPGVKFAGDPPAFQLQSAQVSNATTFISRSQSFPVTVTTGPGKGARDVLVGYHASVPVPAGHDPVTVVYTTVLQLPSKSLATPCVAAPVHKPASSLPPAALAAGVGTFLLLLVLAVVMVIRHRRHRAA